LSFIKEDERERLHVPQRNEPMWNSSISSRSWSTIQARMLTSAKFGRGPHGVISGAPCAKYVPHSPFSSWQFVPSEGVS